MSERDRALLVLEDGRCFSGESFGAAGEAFGEIVFNTSMTGYQEILTDPSYAGQLVCMTFPLIGNYGVNDSDNESRRPWVEGFIVKEASQIISNWRGTETLSNYLRRNKIVAIENIDTRALVRHIRDKGAMRAVISSTEFDEKILLERVLASPRMKNRELASKVSTDTVYQYQVGENPRYHVVCYDFGVKTKSLRSFVELECRITVVPSDTNAEAVAKMDPDGIFLSNGPGDPAAMTSVIHEIEKLAKTETPIFGICLGHQILGLAFGASTYKLKFGHRGGNQPVKNLSTGKIEITAHNHGFAIDGKSLPPSLEITHLNVNDDTVAGIRHRELPIFAVQYHPEAAPGPHDAKYHFVNFIELMKSKKNSISKAN